jgi:metacaspase-1
MPGVKILCVHGVGHAEQDPHWNQPWRDAITNAFTRWNNFDAPEFSVVAYDDLFANAPLNPFEYVAAVGELLASAAWHAIAGPSGAKAFGPPDLGNYAGRWFAGMVAQWVVDEKLRGDCRATISNEIDRFQPDIVCAHSLGTLLCYDLFTFDDTGRQRIQDRTFVSFGSQIGNTFVKAKAWGGRVPMISAKQWYHLFNHQDAAFTAEIQEPGCTNFLEVVTDSAAGHAATTAGNNPGYLDHPNTILSVWQPLARPTAARLLTRAFGAADAKAPQPPSHRAVLIGINAYPDPACRLEGCINDVYLISELLQENGFAATNIRVLLDERASRAAILDRMRWLLDQAEDGSQRVFYYSGHGVQIPGYGVHEQVDHLEDGLVPVDFDWTKLNAITDQDLLEFYSQLPYNARFTAVFDCCYAGGLVKSLRTRFRSLAAPLDIQHRMQKWNSARGIWEPRQFHPINPNLSGSDREAYSGTDGSTYKLGRAMTLRRLGSKEYDSVRQLRDHKGPYLPLVLEACRDDQLSYEYTGGATTNGAFTYALAREYRAAYRRKKPPSFIELVRKVTTAIKNLGFDESPQLIGPNSLISGPILRSYPAQRPSNDADNGGNTKSVRGVT